MASQAKRISIHAPPQVILPGTSVQRKSLFLWPLAHAGVTPINCPCPDCPPKPIMDSLGKGSPIPLEHGGCFLMRLPTEPKRLLDPQQARYVAGVLGMLIAVVGQRTCLGIVL